MQFHIQPIAGGLVSSAVVRRLSEGDTIKMGAPVGEQLTLPEDGPLPDLLMVAGGTGLAPAARRAGADPPKLAGLWLRAAGASVPRLADALEPLRP